MFWNPCDTINNLPNAAWRAHGSRETVFISWLLFSTQAQAWDNTICARWGNPHCQTHPPYLLLCLAHHKHHVGVIDAGVSPLSNLEAAVPEDVFAPSAGAKKKTLFLWAVGQRGHVFLNGFRIHECSDRIWLEHKASDMFVDSTFKAEIVEGSARVGSAPESSGHVISCGGVMLTKRYDHAARLWK